MIIDASVAVKWYLPEADSEKALSLTSRSPLIAPDILVSETANAVWKAARKRTLTQELVLRSVAALPAQFDRLEPTAPLVVRAATIALELDHPVYDCFYVALALREELPMITVDQRLRQSVAGTVYEPNVVSLGDLV